MIYPLFFPFGTPGWHPGMKHENSNKRITRAEYISYHIFQRTGQFNPLFFGKDLFQMFTAENAVRVLKDRLDFIRFNQKKVCAELYKNVKDVMQRDATEPGLPIGRMIILPSTVTASPRWEAEQFADTMAMLMELGKRINIRLCIFILRKT